MVAPMTNGRVSKRWSQRVRINGRETNLGLGGYPVVTLAEARKKALANRRVIEQGLDPRAASRLPTFAQATEEVIALHSQKWRTGSRTAQIWASSLDRFAGSLANVTVDKITTAHILEALSPVWHTKNETARKVKRRIATVMKWSIAQGYRSDNPADDRITAALGRNTRPTTHQRALPHSELGAALRQIQGFRRAHWATREALTFLALTATRSGEARFATWDEIDLTARLWTIPADRTKTGRPHRVPLSAGALAVLHRAHQRTRGEGLAFPSLRGKALSTEGLSKLLKENRVGCVPHGFRTSFRNWCAETGVRREVAERALGHQIANAVERAYSRTDLLDSRRELMGRWGCYLTGS